MWGITPLRLNGMWCRFDTIDFSTSSSNLSESHLLVQHPQVVKPFISGATPLLFKKLYKAGLINAGRAAPGIKATISGHQSFAKIFQKAKKRKKRRKAFFHTVAGLQNKSYLKISAPP